MKVTTLRAARDPSPPGTRSGARGDGRGSPLSSGHALQDAAAQGHTAGRARGGLIAVEPGWWDPSGALALGSALLLGVLRWPPSTDRKATGAEAGRLSFWAFSAESR